MTCLVYSYLRFSDQRQSAGSSVARQIQYAEKWAAARGMKLDTTLSMSDHGLSAFHQRHVTEGALGTFLEAVKAGRVPEGSTLIVEQLDRLSRADVLTAFNQLSSIVTAGVRVITTKDDMEFSREKLAAQPFILFPAITSMILAHEESANKSRRVTESIVMLCKGWVAEKYRGKIRQGKDPQWLSETDDGWQLIPERAEALRMAISWYKAGHSGQGVSKKLAAAGISPLELPLSATHFYKMVKNPNLIGTKQVSAGGQDFDLKDYYPAVLSADEWDDLRAVGGERGRRGAKSTIPHIVTGMRITYCGYCGRAMSGQHLFQKIKKKGDRLKDGYRRLQCAGKNYGAALCPHPVSRSIAILERAIMNFCSDIINLRALYDGDQSAPLREQLREQRQRQAEIITQSEKLMEIMLSTSSGDTPAMFVKRAQDLEGEKAQLARAISKTEAQISALARTDLDGMDLKWASLAKGVQELDIDDRLQARNLIKDTFARITVYSTGIRPLEDDRFTDVVLQAKGGVSRMLRIDQTGAWQALEDVQQEEETA